MPVLFRHDETYDVNRESDFMCECDLVIITKTKKWTVTLFFQKAHIENSNTISKTLFDKIIVLVQIKNLSSN